MALCICVKVHYTRFLLALKITIHGSIVYTWIICGIGYLKIRSGKIQIIFYLSGDNSVVPPPPKQIPHIVEQKQSIGLNNDFSLQFNKTQKLNILQKQKK